MLRRNLIWRLQNEPTAPLSPNEKYLLELCCWHYRKQLGGLVEFELPASQPQRGDYLPERADLQDRLL